MDQPVTISQNGFLKFFFVVFTVFFALPVFSEGNPENLLPFSYITTQVNAGDFVLSSTGKSAPLVLDANDFPGVIKIAGYLQGDIEKVTGAKPHIIMGELQPTPEIVIIGTLGKSSLIDGLVKAGKLNVDTLKGKWEASLIEVVKDPLPNVSKALVIVGSDKRGTIFGMFDLSRQIGVSPWYFWSDVPVSVQNELYVKAGRYIFGSPKVKYRGIFLNDEEPALGRWAVENYGGFNHLFYEKVFELILRLKGNYMWPAMWWAAFNANDPLNPVLADEMGIVMGTSHHEPMTRAQKEWAPYGGKAWNYETNPEQLREFWKGGIERMGDRENIVTLAMRGDGDMAMSPQTNTSLLEKIVADQRKILADVTKKDITKIPQVWALYKEVQDYYDKGMRVPDDITLLLCDDNWGNIRKLPRPGDPPRAGGYGIYYHVDYVGGPRNYKWLNTSPLPRIWEQMNLAYRHGVDRLWVVNVGDLKPMEVPISFFLDFAFDPDVWPASRLDEYTRLWAKEQFGAEHAGEIGEMLRLYTKFNSRRKPELLSPATYSLINFQEAETIRDDYKNLAAKAGELYKKIPAGQKETFYELVLHPIIACANLNELYITAGLNRMYSAQGRSLTNDLRQKVKDLFENDAKLTNYYNTVLAGGKWNHMMDQKHIGYTNWQEPRNNTMPKVDSISIPENAEMGVAIEGSDKFWTSRVAIDSLPEINTAIKNSVYLEIFNKGQKPFNYTIKPGASWLKVEPTVGEVKDQIRLWVMAEWKDVPAGKQVVPIILSGNGQEVTVNAVFFNPGKKIPANVFLENNGYVSIESEHFTRKVESGDIRWMNIPGLGRTLGGMTVTPVTADSVKPGGNSPRLEYDIFINKPGEAEVTVNLLPTLNYFNDDGRKIAVSIDNGEPKIINIHKDNSNRNWETWVSNSTIEAVSTHQITSPGKHTVKVWMVSSGLDIERIVVWTGAKKNSYLGPPESLKSN
jgi:hypothetical protein